MKKNITIILSIIIVIILGIIIGKVMINFNNHTEQEPIKYRYQDLIKVGYSEQEIEWIYQTFDEAHINIALKYPYQKQLQEMVNDDDFKKENLDSYLELITKFPLTVDDIIYIVNEEKYDENVSYNDFVIKILKEKYYLKDNLNRYIDYHDKNQTKSAREVVEDVNTNRDYKYYTHTKKADTSKGNLILVNKYYQLDSNYVPSDLVTVEAKYGASRKIKKEAYEAFITMVEAMKKENKNYNLYISSPYRSYQYQNTLYKNYVKKDGQKEADTYSARPGYSEHQTGLALDITSKSGYSINQFKNTKEFGWVQKNAYKYGFILRYPKDKENITGYIYEPWHYRYVGVDAATTIYNENITFEEYYTFYLK